MGRFDDWLACPECDGDGEVSVLAYRTDLVIECYECGQTAEFRIGSDVPFHNLDERAFAAETDEQSFDAGATNESLSDK